MKKFPVECDRAVVNFICVKPGRVAEQRLTLRNSTQELVTLSAIVRESYLFSLVGSRGPVTSLSVQLEPGQTQELVVRHSPRYYSTKKLLNERVKSPRSLKVFSQGIRREQGQVGSQTSRSKVGRESLQGQHRVGWACWQVQRRDGWD